MSRILIIDDEAAIRNLLSRALTLSGHETELAISGQEGLDLLRKSPPDLVITDIFMPEKDGFYVIEEAHRDYPDIPIFSITAGLGDDCARAREKGAQRTFIKPIAMAELLEAVDQITSRSTSNNH